MNKIFSYSLLAASAITVLGACANEEAAIFDKSAADRLNETKENFTQVLGSNPNSWSFEYFGSTETDADNYVRDMGYLMLLDLKPDGTVYAGMKNYHTDNKYWGDQSLWEVITDMSAVLSFNSYNKVIHRFSEPEDFKGSTSYGGDIGKGMLGDYEFIIVDALEDGRQILLKGKKHGGYSRLTRLDINQDNFEQYLNDVAAKQSELLSNYAPNHLVMNVGEKQYYFIMPNKGGELGLTKLWPAGTDSTFTMVLNPIIFSRQPVNSEQRYVLHFRDKIEGADDVTVQDFYYDPQTQKFVTDDPAIYIEGENPAENFTALFGDKGTYSFNRSLSGSDKFKAVVEAVYQGLNNVKYKLEKFSLKNGDNNTATLRISYKDSKNKTGALIYNFSANLTGDALKLQFVNAENTASQNAMTSISSITELCNLMSGTFSISAPNPLNLTNIELRNGSNADATFVVTYERPASGENNLQ